MFWTKSQELVEALVLDIEKRTSAGKSQSTVVAVGDWASRTTLDIIGVAGMGRDFNSIAEPNGDLNRWYRKIFSPSKTARIMGVMGFFLPQWLIRNLP